MDEKTRRIKEQTVRGLEPEIQRLMARHTAELANLESEREKQLAAQVTHFQGHHNKLPTLIVFMVNGVVVSFRLSSFNS